MAAVTYALLVSFFAEARVGNLPTSMLRTRPTTRQLPYSHRLSLLSQLGNSQQSNRKKIHSSVTANMDQSEAEPQLEAAEPLGVLLLNLGGPETLEDVEPFLYNLFADPDIIRLPSALKSLQPFIAKILSSSRAPKSKEAYESIGGGSPLREITEQQAQALEEALRSKGQDAKVYVAMRYWKPFTEDSIEQIKKDGLKQLVILPLYPQFSISTSGSSLRLLADIFKQDKQLEDLKHTVIPSWYQRPGYVKAMCDLIETELEKFENKEKVEIFFSAHGVPKSYVDEAFDPYQDEMEHSVQLIMRELRERGVKNHETLAYQSRVGPVEWLQPYTEDAIQDLAKKGVDDLLVVPISFVNEHIETLEEIDMEYRELAEEAGIKNWGRVPALNSYPVFIEDLADAVLEAKPYIGSIGGYSDDMALVPGGPVDELIDTYDNAAEQPLVAWEWGFTRNAETINGRIAMIALAALSAVDLLRLM
eukprot:CAMPEP_0184481166 /NCGR_PEP_ID=MMETSP0113_2-20130426/2692_1 /TAXON_ID=91329 /ORGANISM="Norrisiella sphaerica, Strain BC52" /LENGTH=475 /DNA_ID=CAMNT_0026860101 /DNA_START=166 /DNA_END=1593 /DNA_ORIENTATION=-